MTASTVIHPAKKPPTACTGASKRHPECPTSCTLQLSLEQLLMDKKQLNQFKVGARECKSKLLHMHDSFLLQTT